ncbi:wax ester/triacylglycerol synthase family O-acyltransferase [bacterium]|nr:wax ester/triacylglycerol synthase family O-acyltransferase [bacterium]
MARVRRSFTMSRADAAWLHMEDPSNLMMITALFTFKGRLDPAVMRAMLEEKLMPYDRFRMRVGYPKIGIGRPLWKQYRHFNLDDHLDLRVLEAPGDEPALMRLVSELMSTPLDRELALWKFHIVHGFGEGSAMICRIHHAIADGIALLRVLLSMTEQDAEVLEAPNRTGALMVNEASITVKPSKLIDVARGYGTVAQDLGKLLLETEPPSPFRGHLGVSKTAACTQSISLESIKAARQRAGCTVNDVLMAAVAGGLRAHHSRIEGEPAAHINLRAMIPVDLRKPGKEQPLGNRFGLVFLGLPVGLDDPKQRLAEVQKRMNALKRSPQAVVVLGLLAAVGSIPADMQQHIVDLFGSKGTAVVSNVPGPREPLAMAGQAIDSLMFWVPQSGRLGLGISVLSYGGKVKFGVAADANLKVNAQGLAQDIEAALQELIQAL